MTTLSLLVYGVYLIVNGVLLMCVPEIALALVGLEFEAESWIRVVGVLAVEIGFYFVVISRKRVSEFYAPSVYARLGVALGFLILAVTRLGPMQLLIFSAVDTLSALWTRVSMRKD